MATIAHPDGNDSEIEVDVINQESYGDEVLIQVEATNDNVILADESGEAPWVPAEEVDGFEGDA